MPMSRLNICFESNKRQALLNEKAGTLRFFDLSDTVKSDLFTHCAYLYQGERA